MDLADLYRDVIVDHNKRPRNFGRLEHPNRDAEGHNPLCGDRLHLFLDVEHRQLLREAEQLGIVPPSSEDIFIVGTTRAGSDVL